VKAINITGKSPEDIRSALEESRADGYRPTLALVFCSIVHDRETLCSLFDGQGIRIFGATSGGEIAGEESVSQGISVLLLDPHPDHFRIATAPYHPGNGGAEAEAPVRQILNEIPADTFLLGVSFDDMKHIEMGEKILRAITGVAGEKTEVWGGGAGDDFRYRETFVFTNGWESNTGILLLAFDNRKYRLEGHAGSGMKPAGTLKTVTKAQDNWILEVDHKPAAEIIPRFVGITLKEEDYKDFFPHEIFMGLHRGAGEPMIRTAAGFNWENKSIAVTGAIREGDRLQLMMPPEFEALEEVHHEAQRFRKEQMPEADALVMFSCIGRTTHFGPMVNDELRNVQSVYNVPMAGMFSYGEYGKATGGQNEFHNMTCCWVAIKEI
jgi:hypothetical protein